MKCQLIYSFVGYKYCKYGYYIELGSIHLNALENVFFERTMKSMSKKINHTNMDKLEM